MRRGRTLKVSSRLASHARVGSRERRSLSHISSSMPLLWSKKSCSLSCWLSLVTGVSHRVTRSAKPHRLTFQMNSRFVPSLSSLQTAGIWK